jgi:hypothetical protein
VNPRATRREWIGLGVIALPCLLYSMDLTVLITSWAQADVRTWLLVAFASHAVMRIWSAFDFIPKALAFERAEAISESAARAWTRRSWRLPLDLVTCGAMLAAFAAA